ncbi:MAM domain-containing glycosylphosphatidylinositol anchor protein 2-like isoform X1 [Clavelina lepadiformis]|uniref:MAM domain-containing glycosylphosphatidylinositol anchor protein 2-like isoform X1 n=1 Tax=Clavelina lepadiformis TaxID=159417 RepID=UPI004041B769
MCTALVKVLLLISISVSFAELQRFARAPSSYKAPSARISPGGSNNYVINEGGEVRLTCEGAGHPRPSLRWSITGSRLVRNDLNVITSGSASNLTISNITRKQRGRVYCEADNGIRSPYKVSKKIVVAYLDRPVLKVRSGFKNNISILCEVKSIPRAYFVWRRNGARIYPEATVTRKSDVTSVSSSKLILERTPSNVGSYECRAYNKKGYNVYTAESFNYTLDIESTKLARVTPKQIVVNQGDDVDVICNVTAGTPTPKMVWRRDNNMKLSNRTKINDGVLTIAKVTTDDSGQYICCGYNRFESAKCISNTVIVRRLTAMTYWLTPDPTEETRTLAVQTDVTLTCFADAAPSSELRYFWFKRDNRGQREPIVTSLSNNLSIDSSNNVKVVGGFKFPAMSSQLEIRSLRENDYGIYECSAKLDGDMTSKNVSASFMVTREIEPPKISTIERDVIVLEGSTATLRCKADGYQSMIRFFRADNLTMPSGESNVVTKSGTLRITNVNRNDAGIYICSAVRYNGFSKLAKQQTDAFVNLIVQYPPTVEQQNVEIRKPLGSRASFTCSTAEGRVSTFTWFKGLNGSSSDELGSSSSWQSKYEIYQINGSDYGRYTCVVKDPLGTSNCSINFINKPYPPEFLYNDYLTNDAEISSKGKDLFYRFTLMWTQKQPQSTDQIRKYRIQWRRYGASKWEKNIEKSTPGGVGYGEKVSYVFDKLHEGKYEVKVQAITDYARGDPSTRFFTITEQTSPTVPAVVNQEFYCTFEMDDKCGWLPQVNGSLKWQFNDDSYRIRTPGTGPDKDKTLAIKEAGYAFIDSSYKKPGDKARLISPLFSYDPLKSTCLTFFYHMMGRHIGRLRVLTKLGQTGVEEELWRKEGNQGKGWKRAFFEITPLATYQIVFEATITRKRGYQGDIAIDDIVLESSQGCTNHLPVTTTVSKIVTAQGRGKGPSIHHHGLFSCLNALTYFFYSFVLFRFFLY